jgi:hypothetical protein
VAYDNDRPADPTLDDLIRREALRRGISETTMRMLHVGGTDVVQSFVWDHVGKPDVTQPSSMAVTPDRAAPAKGTGWAKERPIRPPEGIEHIDRMVEAATAKERLHTVVEAIEANEALKRASKKKD